MFEKIVWTVQHGKQLWKTIGFPTANVFVDQTTSLDAWTYKVNILIDNDVRPWIGPWFPNKRIFEVHIFDFDEQIYDTQLTIVPLHKIRDNTKFASLDELKQQIIFDVYEVAKQQTTVMTFGTFDHFHPGHEFYLRESKLYGDSLITVIARDSTVKSVKWHLPDHNEDDRLKRVQASRIPDSVVLWHEENYYHVLEQHHPDIICLGYDQSSFDTWIITRHQEHNLPVPQIIRIDSFEPDRYKSSLIRKHTNNDHLL